MEITFTENELTLFTWIGKCADKLNIECHLIGGCVRDKLLHRPTKDADIVCSGSGIELAHAVAEGLQPTPAVSYFKNFGTAHFRYQGMEVEFVGARKESYHAHSRKPDVEPGSMEDDRLRRDFTINALGIALNSHNFGTLSDAFNGLQHLEDGIIVTPTDPDITFSDDPLRMMRAIRFATQLGFTIAPHVLDAITRNADRIKIISQERITDELNKIMAAAKPSVGFHLLYVTKLLPHFFPELVALAGTETVHGIGHKDNFYHTLQVLDNTAARSPHLWLRWAALLHDIGKPRTKKYEQGIGWTFHGHEAVGERMTMKIFKHLKLPQQDNMKYVAKLVLLHMRPKVLSKDEITDSAIRRLLFDAGNDLEDLMILCESDITSKNRQKIAQYLENYEIVKKRLIEVEETDRIRNWQPPLSGDDIMRIFQISPSREVGILKNAIKDAILDGDIPNDYHAAYSLLLQKAATMGLFPKE